MSKQIKARSIRHRPSSIGAREIALAGLGAASLARKQAIKSFAEFSAIAGRLPEASAIFVEGLGERGQALKDTVIAKAASLRQRADNLAGIASAEIGQRIAPLLATLGVKRTPAKRERVARGRANATPTTAAKRAGRKAA